MKKIITNLLLVSLMIVPTSIFSQNCHGTVNYCPRSDDGGFTYNGQSVSGAFVQGDTAQVTVIVYKGMEYRMSLCSPTQEELNGKFSFQVMEKITKPRWKETVTYKTVEKFNEMGEVIGEEKIEQKSRRRVYDKVDVVRYDNKKDNDSQEFLFISDKTRKLTIKVFIPLMDGGAGEGSELGAESYACVGLLIEHQPGPKSGFER